MGARILIVDDDRSLCELIAQGLHHRGFEPVWKTVATDALEILKQEDFDVILTDIRMAGMNGIDFCRWTTSNRPNLPVIVMTAFGELDTAIEALRAGAYDFVTKPFEMAALSMAVERAAALRSLREELTRLRRQLSSAKGQNELIGESPPMRHVRDLVAQVAPSDTGVLITGETGTGKELVARMLHRLGPRSHGPFVPVNCAAIPESLMESEIFGHLRGAFTDASVSRPGLFLQANRGVLFLDEIGELPIALQPKILRALQDHRIRPVGGQEEIPCDVQIIAATHRDLDAEVESGRFRQDLFFRVNVIQIEVPPLRARGNDILLLAQHFLKTAAARTGKGVSAISSAAAELLLSYAWPGNVRELQNTMERAVAVTQFDAITAEDLPPKVREYKPSHVVVASENPSELVTLEEVEMRYIRRVLEAVGGQRAQAAKILGLDRKTLYRKLKENEP